MFLSMYFKHEHSWRNVSPFVSRQIFKRAGGRRTSVLDLASTVRLHVSITAVS